MTRPMRTLVLLLALLLAAGCTADESVAPTPTPTASTTAEPTATGSAAPSEPIETAAPTSSPEPELSIDLPESQDDRQVSFNVDPQLTADGGRILVTITNLSDTRIEEIVLRWPTALDASLFLAPFHPSTDRIADGGNPLVQPWTKWVRGPGERGEPADTTSLGYGPMDPGMTLEIPLEVISRAAPAPVSFDLQFLAGSLSADGSILMTEQNEPAETRVEIP